MKRKRYTEHQIVFALQQAEAGTMVGEICRRMGVAEATSCRWKKRYGGLGVTETQRLKQLEDRNCSRDPVLAATHYRPARILAVVPRW